MNESGRNHRVIRVEMGESVKTRIAPSTVETYRHAMQQLEI